MQGVSFSRADSVVQPCTLARGSLVTDPDSRQREGGSAVGRAAWGRRPPLTRERRNQPSRPGRTGRPLVAKRPQTPAGESGERAGPADGGRDGLGAGPAAIPAVGGKVDYPAEKRPLRAAQRVGVFAVDRENGGFGPIRPDPVRNRTIDLAVAALPVSLDVE